MTNINGLPSYCTIKSFWYDGYRVDLKASRHYVIDFGEYTQFCFTMAEVDKAIADYQDKLLALIPVQN